MKRKLLAELIGTFWLVLGGCGTAVLSGAFGHVGVGILGVSLAFGLTVLTMAYALGSISGGHFNPAVSFGVWVAGRMPTRELVPYVVAQVVGAVLAGAAIYAIVAGLGTPMPESLAANGYGEHSPGGFPLATAALVEVLMTAMFLIVILGATSAWASEGFAPFAIGMALTLIHLISIPVSNTSVNPARSLGVAVFSALWAVEQLWLFWLAPLVGAGLGALVFRALAPARKPLDL